MQAYYRSSGVFILKVQFSIRTSSEPLHNISASTASPPFGSDITLSLQSHKQDGILHIRGDGARQQSP